MLFAMGFIVTLVYFLCLAGIIFFFDLEPVSTWNELGDFLAGAFSPVAFLWLVLGYMQQQKELVQNTKALELQAEELRNSVDQYRDMVVVAREQLEMDRDVILKAEADREKLSKPRVSPPNIEHFINVNGRGYKASLQIGGGNAYNLKIKTTPPFAPLNGYYNSNVEVGFCDLGRSDWMMEAVAPENLGVEISYESLQGKKFTDVYFYRRNGSVNFSLVRE